MVWPFGPVGTLDHGIRNGDGGRESLNTNGVFKEDILREAEILVIQLG